MRVVIIFALFLYICAIDATAPALPLFGHWTYSPDHNVFGVGTQNIRVVCENPGTVITDKVLFLVDDTASDCTSASNWKVGGSIGSFVIGNPNYFLDVTIPNINATGCWKMIFYTAATSYEFESYKLLQDNSRSYGRVLPPLVVPSTTVVPFSVANDPAQGFPVRFSNVNSNGISFTFYLPNGSSVPGNCSRTPNAEQQYTCSLPVPLNSPSQVGYLEATLSVLGLTTNRTVVAVLYQHVSSLKPPTAFTGVPTRISVRGPAIQASDKYILTSAASCSAAAVNTAFPASAGSQPLTFNSNADLRGCFCKYAAGVTDCTQIAHFVETGPLGALHVRDNSTILTNINLQTMYMPASSALIFDLPMPLFPSLYNGFGGVAAQSDAQSDPITSFLEQIPANASPFEKMMAMGQAFQMAEADALVPKPPSVSTKGPFAVVPGHLTCAGASNYSTMSAPGRLSFLDVQKVSFVFGTTMFKPNVYPEELTYCVCFENCDQDSSWVVQASVPQLELIQAPFLDTVSPIVLSYQNQLLNFTGHFPLYPSDYLGVTFFDPTGMDDDYNTAWPNSNDDGGPWMIVQWSQMTWAWVDVYITDWTDWPAEYKGNILRVYTSLPIADSVQAEFGSSTLNITGRYFSATASQSAIHFAPESPYNGTCTVTTATTTNLIATCTEPFNRIMRYKLWVEDTRCATPLDGPNGRKYAFLEFPPQDSAITSITPSLVTIGSGNVSIALSGSLAANGGAIGFIPIGHSCDELLVNPMAPPTDFSSFFAPRPLPIVNSNVTVWPRVSGQYQLCYCAANATDCFNSTNNYFLLNSLRLTVRTGNNVVTSLQGPSTLLPTPFNNQTATLRLSNALPQDLQCSPSAESPIPFISPRTFWTRNTTHCDLPSQMWMPFVLCNSSNPGDLIIPAPGALGSLQAGSYKLCVCVGECNTAQDFAMQSGVSFSVVPPPTPVPTPTPTPPAHTPTPVPPAHTPTPVPIQFATPTLLPSPPRPTPIPTPVPLNGQPTLPILVLGPEDFVSPSLPVNINALSPNATALSWSVEAGSAPLNLDDSRSVRLSGNNRFLRINPGVLAPSSTYVLRVSGSAEGFTPSFALVAFSTCGVPVNGSLDVWVKRGLAPGADFAKSLNSTIRMATANWIDSMPPVEGYDPLPFTFKFTSQVAGMQEMTINFNTSMSAQINRAPPVRESTMVVFRVYAFNRYGGMSNVTVAFRVEPADASVDQAALTQSLVGDLRGQVANLPPADVVLQVANIAQQLALQQPANGGAAAPPPPPPSVLLECVSFLANSTNAASITSTGDIETRAGAIQLLSSQPASSLTPSLVRESMSFVQNLANAASGNGVPVSTSAAADLLATVGNVMQVAANATDGNSASLVTEGQKALNSIALAVTSNSGEQVVIGDSNSPTAMAAVKGSPSDIKDVPLSAGAGSTVTMPDLSSQPGIPASVGLVSVTWKSNPFAAATVPARSTLQSKVVTINLVDAASGATRSVHNLANPVKIEVDSPGILSKETASCRYYNVTKNSWDDAGCTVFAVANEKTTCTCTHLTDFGVFSQPLPTPPSGGSPSGDNEGSEGGGNALAALAVLVLIPIFIIIYCSMKKKKENNKVQPTTRQVDVQPQQPQPQTIVIIQQQQPVVYAGQPVAYHTPQ